MFLQKFEAQLVKFIATVGYIGYAPVMPGTVASAALTLLYLATPERTLYIKIFMFAALAGTLAAHMHALFIRKKDSPTIVIDEIAGMALALLIAEPIGLWVIPVFALFRLFDIYKPWPISALEKLPGGLGIMADDLAAGACAGGTFALVYWLVTEFTLSMILSGELLSKVPLINKVPIVSTLF